MLASHIREPCRHSFACIATIILVVHHLWHAIPVTSAEVMTTLSPWSTTVGRQVLNEERKVILLDGRHCLVVTEKLYHNGELKRIRQHLQVPLIVRKSNGAISEARRSIRLRSAKSNQKWVRLPNVYAGHVGNPKSCHLVWKEAKRVIRSKRDSTHVETHQVVWFTKETELAISLMIYLRFYVDFES